MARVLCIGGAGFIGSYITRELLGEGHNVTVVDDFSKYGRLEHDFFANTRCALVESDVRALNASEFAGYDVILCLAALIGGIRYFNRIPYKIARDNTEILNHCIDATLTGCPEALFVYFSSSMVYERMERPVTEEDATRQPVPLTNYGMQKLFGEYLVRGAHEERGLRYLIVRPFNAVGSGELPAVDRGGEVEFGMAHVIPDFIYKSLIKQRPFEIFGDGRQVRTFTHARDIATGVRLLLEAGIASEDFNICGITTLDMSTLAHTVWEHVNPQEVFPGFLHMPVPDADVRMRIGHSAKLSRTLNWTPQLDLDFIIEDACQYIREHLARPV